MLASFNFGKRGAGSRRHGPEDPFTRDLVVTEATLLVAGAAGQRQAIRARLEARAILAHYPECGMTEDEISEVIFVLAAERHLPIDTAY